MEEEEAEGNLVFDTSQCVVVDVDVYSNCVAVVDVSSNCVVLVDVSSHCVVVDVDVYSNCVVVVEVSCNCVVVDKSSYCVKAFIEVPLARRTNP